MRRAARLRPARVRERRGSAATHLDLSATLTASRGYPGRSRHRRLQRRPRSREADINLTGTRRPTGQRVTIYLAGKKLGTVTVSRQGRMHRD